MIQLSKREQKMATILGGILALFIIWTFIVSPIIDSQSSIESHTNVSKSRLMQLDQIHAKYQTAKRKKRLYDSKLKHSGLHATVEENAKKFGLKPTTSENHTNVQNKFKKFKNNVKFESAAITSILKFIHSIENSNKLVRITGLRIRLALKGRKTYDANLTIESLAK